jgi:hypothetical protein
MDAHETVGRWMQISGNSFAKVAKSHLGMTAALETHHAQSSES